MFTCILQHCVASTALALKLLANVTEGTDSMRIMVLLVDRRMEISAPSEV